MTAVIFRKDQHLNAVHLFGQGTTQVKAFTTSAAIDAVVTSDYVEIIHTAPEGAYIKIAAAPTALVTDRFLPANTPLIVKVNDGVDKVAALQVTNGGNLHVTNLT